MSGEFDKIGTGACIFKGLQSQKRHLLFQEVMG